MMNEGHFPAGGRFRFLLPSQTLPLLAGNSLLVIQKAKLLNMNSQFWLPPQSERFRKDNNDFDKFDTYETFANDKRTTTTVNTIYLY